MALEIVIPKLGMTMKEGTVAAWLVDDGAAVSAEQPLYRLTTEKLDHEEVAPASGTVHVEVAAGATLPTGTRIGWLLAAGESVPAGAGPAVPLAGGAAEHEGATVGSRRGRSTSTDGGVAATPANGRVIASPAARRLARTRGVSLDGVRGSGPGGRIVLADVPELAPRREVVASPVARQLAQRLGVDLAGVAGTGPGGRITKDDVTVASRGFAGTAAAASGPAAPPASRRDLRRTPMRGMRGVIAARMYASLQEMAQLTLTSDVAVDELVKLRTGLVDEWADAGIRPTYTDLVVRATAKALVLHPNVNAAIVDDAIVEQDHISIGIAVSLAAGLIVPVVRHTDRIALRELAAETSRLAAAARAGTLTYDEIDGSTFSVTALGSQGIDAFTPIVNPPNVAILGVGRIKDAVRWDGDRPVRQQRMVLSLTIDHRALDGAPAADFLGTLRELLESPYRLLV